jgi:hypothetical protein
MGFDDDNDEYKPTQMSFERLQDGGKNGCGYDELFQPMEVNASQNHADFINVVQPP